MVDLGQGFTPRFGRVIDQMPVLIAAGEIPISMDHALEQQYAHPETWGEEYIFTGDACLKSSRKDVVIELDSLLLRSVDSNSTLSFRVLVLSEDQWEERKSNVKNLYLTPKQVQEASRKGYVKKNGVWRPENQVVEEVWNALGRGRNLQDHAELASQKSNNDERVMELYFNSYLSFNKQPTLQPWTLNGLSYRSVADGLNDLDHKFGKLVGVAPDTRRIGLEEKIQQ